MENREIINNLFTNIENKNFEKALELVSEDFQLIGPTPEPASKEMWFGMIKSMDSAFTGFRYNVQVVSDEADKSKISVKLEGRHTSDLAIPGMQAFPATNKSFALPREGGTAHIRDGKITRLDMKTSEEGGVKGILGQLGLSPE